MSKLIKEEHSGSSISHVRKVFVDRNNGRDILPGLSTVERKLPVNTSSLSQKPPPKSINLPAPKRVAKSTKRRTKSPSKKKKTKSRRKPVDRTHASTFVERKFILSSALASFLKTPSLARKDITRDIWKYVEQHNLKVSSNIMCDSKLQALFGVSTIPFLSLQGHISKHILGPELNSSEKDMPYNICQNDTSIPTNSVPYNILVYEELNKPSPCNERVSKRVLDDKKTSRKKMTQYQQCQNIEALNSHTILDRHMSSLHTSCNEKPFRNEPHDLLLSADRLSAVPRNKLHKVNTIPDCASERFQQKKCLKQSAQLNSTICENPMGSNGKKGIVLSNFGSASELTCSISAELVQKQKLNAFQTATVFPVQQQTMESEQRVKPVINNIKPSMKLHTCAWPLSQGTAPALLSAYSTNHTSAIRQKITSDINVEPIIENLTNHSNYMDNELCLNDQVSVPATIELNKNSSMHMLNGSSSSKQLNATSLKSDSTDVSLVLPRETPKIRLRLSNIRADGVQLDISAPYDKHSPSSYSLVLHVHYEVIDTYGNNTHTWERCRTQQFSFRSMNSNKEYFTSLPVDDLHPTRRYRFRVSFPISSTTNSSSSVFCHSNNDEASHNKRNSGLKTSTHKNATLKKTTEGKTPVGNSPVVISEIFLMSRNDISSWSSQEVVCFIKSLNIPGFAEKCKACEVKGSELVLFCEKDLIALGVEKWFPENATITHKKDNVMNDDKRPRARLLCFHGAGSDSTQFTSKGTVKRPMPNPLVTYCSENNIQLLTVHLPGRTYRLTESCVTSAFCIAEKVLDLLQPVMFPVKASDSESWHDTVEETPLLIAGHSMGAICAYELACLMRYRQLPVPKHLILSCMVPPDTPLERRPWKQASSLSSQQLQDECREWGINSEVFVPGIWSMYEPILRSDFSVLDTYNFSEPGKALLEKSAHSSTSTSPSSSPPSTEYVNPNRKASSFHAPLGVSTTVFYATNDKKITRDSVAGWEKIVIGSALFSNSPSGFGTIKNSAAEFKIKEINGSHNFFYEIEGRLKWMDVVSEILDKILIDLEYGC